MQNPLFFLHSMTECKNRKAGQGQQSENKVITVLYYI